MYSCVMQLPFDSGKVSNHLKTVEAFLGATPNEIPTFIFASLESLYLNTA